MKRHDLKKKFEEHYFKILQKEISYIPKGKLKRNESPDLILQTDLEIIGIEVTCIFKSPDSKGISLQSQESERKSLINEAICIYEKMKLPSVNVWIIFSLQTSFNKHTRKRDAKILSNLIAHNLPSKNSKRELKNHYGSPHVFPNGIMNIYIHRYDFSQNNWFAIDGGVMIENFIGELQSRISKKNLKLSKYKQDCSSYWLLVVIKGMSGSTLFRPSEKTLNNTYKCEFNKVFLLDYVSKRGYELKITSKYNK